MNKQERESLRKQHGDLIKSLDPQQDHELMSRLFEKEVIDISAKEYIKAGESGKGRADR